MTEHTVNEPILQVKDLRVNFGLGKHPLQAVRGVDFVLNRGETLGIVGESGSGKSVTAAAVLHLLGRDARVTGSILWQGRELASLTKDELRDFRGRTAAMIFQEPSRSFDPIYSIGKTFYETFRAKDKTISKSESDHRAIRLLTEVHIPHAAQRLKNFPHQFSGGMLQRIMIALALANDPEVLIADEPTTALDVTIQAQVVALLKETQQRRGLTLVFISHDLELVGQISDRIQVMYGGLVLETGTAEQVLTRPVSPYTAALLKSRPSLTSHYSRDRMYSIPGNIPDPTRPEPGCPFAPRCAKADDLCRTSLPPLTDQRYRCHHPGEPT